MQIDYVSDIGGDWEGLYINGDLFYDGHSIPTHKWLQLVALVGSYSPIREWVSDLEIGGRYPDQLISFELEELRETE